MNNYFTLLEHHSLYIGKDNPDDHHIGLPKPVFEEIETFVHQNSDESTDFLKPSFMKGYGQTLKAQQYVGVIETKSGTVIEILPKIAGEDKKETRKTFLKMLKELKDSPFKHFDTANLKTDRMHLLEIFISMFCEELAVLVRRGIKSDYISRDENSKFLKGRLKLAAHIRTNIVHKERFYVEHDEYMHNRVENRIIKTTLHYLYKKSKSNENKKRIREFLFVFDDIDPILDVKTAFSKISVNRQMKDYELVLKWSRLFLNNESFTAFKGNSVAFALLFDMNRVFEDYVAHCLKANYPDISIKTQVGTEHLLVSPRKEFKLKPDLLIGETIVADTKWKLLNKDKNHSGISQADIYQMYAYGKKYEGIEEVHLIYPQTEDFPDISAREYSFDENIKLRLFPFDCKTGTIANYDIVYNYEMSESI